MNKIYLATAALTYLCIPISVICQTTNGPDFTPSVAPPSSATGTRPIFPQHKDLISSESVPDGEVDAQNWYGTKLYRYDDCSDDDVSKIDEAYADMGKLARLAGVANDIIWDGA